jgi:hypothetical protein
VSISIKHALQDAANHLSNDIPQYINSLMHKSFTWIGGASAAYQLSPTGSDYIPDFLMPLFSWLWHLDWLQLFSTYAVLALCVERTFVLWAWYRRAMRGDYDAGKPQE